jgi:Flp pilus assembly protein TadD
LEAVLARVKKAMGKQEWGVARRGWEEVLRRDGKHPGALVNLGWLAQREQRWGEAEGYLRRAVRLAVEDGSIWMGIGVACLEQGKLEAATAAFGQTVSLEPKNARAHRLLGLTLGRRGWLDGAEEELRRSIEIEPEDAGAHYNLALVYLRRRPVALEMARRHYFKARDLGAAPDQEVEKALGGMAAE